MMLTSAITGGVCLMIPATKLQPFPKLDGSQPCLNQNLSRFYYANGSPRSGRFVPAEDREPRDVENAEHVEISTVYFCQRCPFIVECANWGIHHERYGVWGGLTEEERDYLRKRGGITLVDPSAGADHGEIKRNDGNMTLSATGDDEWESVA